jgi:hypothetical protein
MEECFKHGDVKKYLIDRNSKYLTYKEFFDFSILPSYYFYWLSGFIEAEGCFTIRKTSNGCCSFSIGQKGELALLEAIKKYFGASNKITIKNNDFYLLDIYNRASLIQIIYHCSKYPLLGGKFNSFQIFQNFHNSLN